jgi:uncharacterized protein
MEENYEINLRLNNNQRGEFYIDDENGTVARMEISIDGDRLIVFHTEVSEELKGRNLGKKMLDHMAAYAREKNLKVIPLCPFVNAQFKRNEKKYEDIWLKDIHGR